MPNEYETLLDIQKHKGNDAGVALIDETSRYCPEIDLLPAKAVKGTDYKTVVCTNLPQIKFRKANKGSVKTKAKYANRTFQCYNATPQWAKDLAVCQANPDETPEEMMAREAAMHVKASIQHCCSQLYYGTGIDENGFPGLLAAYDRENMEIDATGSQAGEGSSVWLVKRGTEDIQWITGMDGLFVPSDVILGEETDEDGATFPAYKQFLNFWMGLQVASQLCVVRIKNLTKQAGKGLTDHLLEDAIELAKVGFEPDLILMSKRSRKQLKQSRTATTVTGAPAEMPKDHEGIPIVATESIVNTEAIEA